jgi:hypothetical protein
MSLKINFILNKPINRILMKYEVKKTIFKDFIKKLYKLPNRIK